MTLRFVCLLLSVALSIQLCLKVHLEKFKNSLFLPEDAVQLTAPLEMMLQIFTPF